MVEYSFDVTQEEAGIRVDLFLVKKLPNLTRSRLQALLKQGHIVVDHHTIEPSRKLKAGQLVSVIVPAAEEPQPQAQTISFDVIYEDDDLIVVNKPAGLVVHPGAGNPDRTLVNGLIAHCGGSLSGIGGVRRPGIVHRLDKGTSGLMVVAKNDFTHLGLSAQFVNRTLKRTYIAFCWGIFTSLSGTIIGNIGRDPRHRQRMKLLKQGGKEAITEYKVLKKLGPHASIVECRLKTGRTHQIRVHLASLNHGLIGDALYSKVPRMLAPNIKQTLAELTQHHTRPCLHAFQIEFIHPRSLQHMIYTAPWPQDLIEIKGYLEQLN